MYKLWVCLGGLAQLVSCASRLMTSASIEHAYDARALTTGVSGIRDVAVVGDDELVLISGGHEPWSDRTLTRLRGGVSEPFSSMPEELAWCRGEGLTVRDDGSWWYSRCGGGRDKLLAHIITSKAPSTPSSFPIARFPGEARGWLPLDGDDPSGVLLSVVDQDEWRLRAELVTRAGKQELGVFERSAAQVILEHTWQAHRLPDDRIALISIEKDPAGESSAVMLRLMGEGEVTESRLPFNAGISYTAVASVVAENGDLAIVAAIRGGGVVAITIDEDSPQLGHPQTLSGPGDAALTFPGVHVIAKGGRFVTAWIRESDHAVRLCEFERGFSLPPVSAGHSADHDNRFLVLRPATESIDLFWMSTDGLMWRRLPERPTGYLMAAELWTALRQFLEKIGSSSPQPCKA